MNEETIPHLAPNAGEQKNQPKHSPQESVLLLTMLAIVFSIAALIIQPEWVTFFGVIAICWLTKDICLALLKQGRG